MTSLFELLEKIVGTEGNEVELEIPEEGVNLLSLRILKREAERRGKTLKFKADGPRGKQLIVQLEEDLIPGEEEEEGAVKEKLGRSGRLRYLLTMKYRRVILISLLLFGILLFLGGGTYWVLNFLPRAEVTLTLNPVPMAKEISVSASTESTEVDAEGNVIPGTELIAEEAGQKSTSATGAATVGEKATGTARFVNGGTEEVHISPGTKIIETTKSLVFATANEAPIDVPPASSTTTVEVTAEQIGSAYNLGAGKLFSVEGETAISAVNDNAFTGGESHEVTIVSSADRAKVLAELKVELVEKGKASLSAKAGSSLVIVQEAIKEEVVEENFLQGVGEQADKVSLSLKMKFTTIAYQSSDLEDFISQAFSELVPDDYELYPGETDIDAVSATLGGTALDFTAKVTAQVIPKLDLEEIKNNLLGRNAAGAQEYLASLSNVEAYELRLWPKLPEKLRRVPKNKDRIRIELKTAED